MSIPLFCTRRYVRTSTTLAVFLLELLTVAGRSVAPGLFVASPQIQIHALRQSAAALGALSRDGDPRRVPEKSQPATAKGSLHQRNKHTGRYDFDALVKACPELEQFVFRNAYNDLSVDFKNPEAVKTLNLALLRLQYGVVLWQLPEGYLCPPVPGRADYVHNLADLLAFSNEGVIPQGASVRGLDIGVGANCIYPIIGHCEYGWSWVGADIDPEALASAQRTVEENNCLSNIEFRRQQSPKRILKGILSSVDSFDFSVCNPPFHSSMEKARKGTERKWRNLGVSTAKTEPLLNFGGHATELCFPGGEGGFVRRMIEESATFPSQVLWYTTLVSKEENIPNIIDTLDRVGAFDVKRVALAHGQKSSRVVAWTFMNDRQQKEWRTNWTS